MPDDDFDAASFAVLAATLNEITVTPEQLPGVARNLENFRELHSRINAGAPDEPPDPLGLYRP